jgi:hypothetical protein
MKRIAVLFTALLFLLLLPGKAVLGQNLPVPHKKVIQFSGQVLASDSPTMLEGVAVYVPGTTRGSHTRKSGYFSMPVVEGDTVVFAAMGYEKLYLTIPIGTKETDFTVTIRLEEKAHTLPTVNVMPWATEYDLKQAILEVKLPEEPGQRRPSIPPPVAYKSILDMPAMSASQNFRYGQQLLQQGRESRYRAPDVVRIIGVPIR